MRVETTLPMAHWPVSTPKTAQRPQVWSGEGRAGAGRGGEGGQGRGSTSAQPHEAISWY